MLSSIINELGSDPDTNEAHILVREKSGRRYIIGYLNFPHIHVLKTWLLASGLLATIMRGLMEGSELTRDVFLTGTWSPWLLLLLCFILAALLQHRFPDVVLLLSLSTWLAAMVLSGKTFETVSWKKFPSLSANYVRYFLTVTGSWLPHRKAILNHDLLSSSW